jgi:hypothetical protein
MSALLLLVGGLLSTQAVRPTATTGWDPVVFLRGEAGLSAADVASVKDGKVMAKVIPTPDHTVILSLGVVWVEATAARVSERLQAIESRRREPWMKQIGRVEPDELDRLTLDAADLRDLAHCRLYDCEVRLPPDAIEALRERVDWTLPTREARANEVFRGFLRAYLGEYLARGYPGLFEYANNHDPVRVGASLQGLVARSGFLQPMAPDFYRFLWRFPEGRPSDVKDVLYWSKERFWLKDVTTVNHLTVLERPTPDGTLVLAVSRQLYATHYYESSLSATLFLEAGDSGCGFLVFLDRTKADIRRSGFTFIERFLLKRLVQGRLEAQMSQLKVRIEAP